MNKNVLKFKRFIKELSDNPNIDITHNNIGQPLSQEIFDMLVTTFGIAGLPLDISDFFRNVSIMEIEWECELVRHNIKSFDENDKKIEGSIKLFSIENMLMSNDRISDLVTSIEDDEKEDFKNFRYFDDSDDFIRVGFIIDKKKRSSKLVYLQQDINGLINFPLNFEEYITKMIACKGFIGWNYNILYPETRDANRMDYYLEKIFSTK